MGRYSKISTSKDANGVESYNTVRYPEIPFSDDDLYLITEQGDRLDILANQFFGDSSLWWVISSANYGLLQNSYYLPTGVQLRIPNNIDSIIRKYDNENN